MGPVIEIPISILLAFGALVGLDWLVRRWTDDTFN